MARVTVNGGASPAQSIDFPDAPSFALAESLATVFGMENSAGIEVLTAGGAASVPAGVQDVVVNATAPATLTTSASINLIGAAGGVTLTAAPGTTDNIAIAGGNNQITLGAGAAYNIATGSGNDSIVAGGSGTVNAGGGADTVEAAIDVGTTATIIASGTNQLIVAGDGAATIEDTGSNSTIFGGNGGLFIDGPQTLLGPNGLPPGGTGNLFVSQGTETIFGGAGGTYFFEGSSTLFVGSKVSSGSGFAGLRAYNGSDTISCNPEYGTATVFGGNSDVVSANFSSLLYVSGGGAATIDGGAIGDLIFGAPNANILYGDEISAVAPRLPPSGAEIVAGAGNETLNASFSSAAQVIFAGSGSASIVGGRGANTLYAGTGANTVTGGAGADLFAFVRGLSGGTEVVTDFNATGGDQVLLGGYGVNEVAAALATARVAGGSTTITLADSTQVQFSGVTQLNAASFLAR